MYKKSKKAVADKIYGKHLITSAYVSPRVCLKINLLQYGQEVMAELQ